MRNPKEIELISEYQRTRSDTALNSLIKMHLPFIISKSKAHYRIFKTIVSWEDLHSAAIIGFIKGVKKFNVTNDNKLLTYAYPWMRSEMFDEFVRAFPVHIPHHQAKKLCWGDEKESGTAQNELLRKICEVAPLQKLNQDGTSGDIRIQLRNQYQSESVEETYARFVLPEDMNKAINKLSYEEQKFVEMKLNGYNMTEIRTEWNITSDELQSLLRKIQRKLRKHECFAKVA